MAVVGWLGLGKLGAPCAAALQYHGAHEVVGYDVRGTDVDAYDFANLPPVKLVGDVAEVVGSGAGAVFVTVQTPHAPAYGGETVVPDEPREFEYAYLVNACRVVCREAARQRRDVALVVASTVLPGTFNRYLRPLLNEHVAPYYHPFFPAMGTVVADFVDPELVLVGVDDHERDEAVRLVDELYTFHDAPRVVTSIESAELAKVAYNTFITTKIVFANALAELADVTGADVDEVTDALAQARQRVVSSRYLRAGMGDGGPCHPRDNVALSALARRLGTSVDVMGFLVRAREAQTARLADLVQHWHELSRLPVAVLGAAYKPEIGLVDGSAALLLGEFLRERRVPVAHWYDPYVDNREPPDDMTYKSHVYVVATGHVEFADYDYPIGSVVIDPIGYVNAPPGVTLVTPGRKR